MAENKIIEIDLPVSCTWRDKYYHRQKNAHIPFELALNLGLFQPRQVIPTTPGAARTDAEILSLIQSALSKLPPTTDTTRSDAEISALIQAALNDLPADSTRTDAEILALIQAELNKLPSPATDTTRSDAEISELIQAALDKLPPDATRTDAEILALVQEELAKLPPTTDATRSDAEISALIQAALDKLPADSTRTDTEILTLLQGELDKLPPPVTDTTRSDTEILTLVQGELNKLPSATNTTRTDEEINALIDAKITTIVPSDTTATTEFVVADWVNKGTAGSLENNVYTLNSLISKTNVTAFTPDGVMTKTSPHYHTEDTGNTGDKYIELGFNQLTNIQYIVIWNATDTFARMNHCPKDINIKFYGDKEILLNEIDVSLPTKDGHAAGNRINFIQNEVSKIRITFIANYIESRWFYIGRIGFMKQVFSKTAQALINEQRKKNKELETKIEQLANTAPPPPVDVRTDKEINDLIDAKIAEIPKPTPEHVDRFITADRADFGTAGQVSWPGSDTLFFIETLTFKTNIDTFSPEGKITVSLPAYASYNNEALGNFINLYFNTPTHILFIVIWGRIKENPDNTHDNQTPKNIKISYYDKDDNLLKEFDTILQERDGANGGNKIENEQALVSRVSIQFIDNWGDTGYTGLTRIGFMERVTLGDIDTQIENKIKVLEEQIKTEPTFIDEFVVADWVSPGTAGSLDVLDINKYDIQSLRKRSGFSEFSANGKVSNSIPFYHSMSIAGGDKYIELGFYKPINIQYFVIWGKSKHNAFYTKYSPKDITVEYFDKDGNSLQAFDVTLAEKNGGISGNKINIAQENLSKIRIIFKTNFHQDDQIYRAIFIDRIGFLKRIPLETTQDLVDAQKVLNEELKARILELKKEFEQVNPPEPVTATVEDLLKVKEERLEKASELIPELFYLRHNYAILPTGVNVNYDVTWDKKISNSEELEPEHSTEIPLKAGKSYEITAHTFGKMDTDGVVSFEVSGVLDISHTSGEDFSYVDYQRLFFGSTKLAEGTWIWSVTTKKDTSVKLRIYRSNYGTTEYPLYISCILKVREIWLQSSETTKLKSEIVEVKAQIEEARLIDIKPNGETVKPVEITATRDASLPRYEIYKVGGFEADYDVSNAFTFTDNSINRTGTQILIKKYYPLLYPGINNNQGYRFYVVNNTIELTAPIGNDVIWFIVKKFVSTVPNQDRLLLQNLIGGQDNNIEDVSAPTALSINNALTPLDLSSPFTFEIGIINNKLRIFINEKEHVLKDTYKPDIKYPLTFGVNTNELNSELKVERVVYYPQEPLNAIKAKTDTLQSFPVVERDVSLPEYEIYEVTGMEEDYDVTTKFQISEFSAMRVEEGFVSGSEYPKLRPINNSEGYRFYVESNTVQFNFQINDNEKFWCFIRLHDSSSTDPRILITNQVGTDVPTYISAPGAIKVDDAIAPLPPESPFVFEIGIINNRIRVFVNEKEHILLQTFNPKIKYPVIVSFNPETLGAELIIERIKYI